ncbi:MAG: hypothetical protein GF417_03075 [Candidatus Latescibacteria bacterium]|nr:hypothetical protein [bacterium]MBD3423411.1 hypothetical protein [Candidatus Latescibacterota bacterium]
MTKGLLILSIIIPLLTCYACKDQKRQKMETVKPAEEKGGSSEADSAVVLEDWRFSFRLHSDKWKLLERGVEEAENKVGFCAYKREGIMNDRGIMIEPVISFIFENVPDSTSLMMYEVFRRPKNLELDRAFIHENSVIELKRAIGWVGSYERGGVKHIVKTVTAIDGRIGLLVIMDSTSGVFPKVEKEFDYTLKSMKFIPAN